MKIPTLILTLVFAVLLHGCAFTSGVLPMGPDTYTISTSSEFGSHKAKQKALQEANAYAQTKGKHMIPIRTNEGRDIDFLGDKVNTYELVFRLVDEDDPEYQRTNLKKEADVIVETKSDVDLKVTEEGEKNFDLYTELTKLNELKEKGILTEIEFQAEKAKILNKL